MAVSSIEENVEDIAKEWLKKFGVKYYTKNTANILLKQHHYSEKILFITVTKQISIPKLLLNQFYC